MVLFGVDGEGEIVALVHWYWYECNFKTMNRSDTDVSRPLHINNAVHMLLILLWVSMKGFIDSFAD